MKIKIFNKLIAVLCAAAMSMSAISSVGAIKYYGDNTAQYQNDVNTINNSIKKNIKTLEEIENYYSQKRKDKLALSAASISKKLDCLFKTNIYYDYVVDSFKASMSSMDGIIKAIKTEADNYDYCTEKFNEAKETIDTLSKLVDDAKQAHEEEIKINNNNNFNNNNNNFNIKIDNINNNKKLKKRLSQKNILNKNNNFNINNKLNNFNNIKINNINNNKNKEIKKGKKTRKINRNISCGKINNINKDIKINKNNNKNNNNIKINNNNNKNNIINNIINNFSNNKKDIEIDNHNNNIKDNNMKILRENLKFFNQDTKKALVNVFKKNDPQVVGKFCDFLKHSDAFMKNNVDYNNTLINVFQTNLLKNNLYNEGRRIKNEEEKNL